ncbi:response regulator [Azospirillum melinis]|uniref:response regulator n=1 Tax=Azospirillum TaxID=191 RepID=UPI000D64D881|nr:response regulator [Azospirillum sp. TSA6c]
MSHKLLNDRRVLIVEDEFLVTVVLEAALQEAGASVVRLAASTVDALALIEAEPFDVALLDARLDEEPVADVAEALEKRGIPFVFHSGYGPEHLPSSHRHRPLLRKPSLSSSVVHALYEAMK